MTGEWGSGGGGEEVGGAGQRAEVVTGLEVCAGADQRLSRAGSRKGFGRGVLGGAQIRGREVHLGLAAVDAGDVDFDEELAAGQGSAAEPGPGQDVGGDGDPGETLFFSQGGPAFGDGGEGGADGALTGGAGVSGDEGGVGDLAVAVALPDGVATFAGHGVGPVHGSVRVRIHREGRRNNQEAKKRRRKESRKEMGDGSRPWGGRGW